MRIRSRIWLLLGSLAFAACGGGGGGGGGDPTPVPFDLVGTAPGAATVDDVQTAFDASGSGVTVWIADSGLRPRLIGSWFSTTTQSWSSEVLLATGGIYDSFRFVLARGPNDFAILLRSDSGVYALNVAGGAFGAPQALDVPVDPEVGFSEFALVAGASGYVAAWSRSGGSASPDHQVRASVRSTGSVQWTPATKLSGAGDARSFAVAADGSNYLLVFEEDDDLYANYHVLGNWRADALPMESLPGPVSSMDLASDGSGFQVVWLQEGSGTRTVYTAAFDPAFVKSANAALATSNLLSGGMRIVTDGNGYLVAWTDGSPSDLVARRGAGAIWSPPAVLDDPATDDSVGSEFLLATNGAGFAAVWVQDDSGGQRSLWASLYNGGWGPAVTLETGDGYVWNSRLQLASDGTGYAATWAQADGPDSHTASIYANRYNGTTWSGAALLETGDDLFQDPPRLTLRGTQYVACWAQQAADDSGVLVNVSGYNGGAGAFNPPANLARIALGGSAWPARVLGNAGGLTLCLWDQRQGLASRAWAAVADAAGEFGAPEPIVSEYGFSPDGVAATADGFAVILSPLDPATNRIRVAARRFDGQDWLPPVFLDGGALTGWMQSAAIASNGSGYMAAWVQEPAPGGDRFVYASMWDGGDWTAPVALSDGGAAQSVRIASNGAGYAVTWDTLADGNVPVNVFDGASWSGRTVIATPPNQTFPEIVSDGAGYLVHWNTWDPGATVQRNYACVSPTGAAAGFEAATPLSGDTTNAQRAEAATDGDGYALVWTEDGESRLFGRVRTGGAWSAAARIDATDRLSRISGIAGGADGYAVLWTERDGDDREPATLRARVFSGGAWGTPADLETTDRSLNPWGEVPGAVASEGAGYAAVWTQVAADGLSHVFLSRFDGLGWTRTQLESQGASAIDVRIAPVGPGYSVFWTQPDPAGDLAVARPWAWLGLE